MAAGDIASRSNSLSDVQNILNIFKGTGTTTTSNTSSETVSDDKAQAYLKSILESSSGLAAVSSGQKAAGMYGSTVNTQLTNDLLARASAQTAQLSATKTTTQSSKTGAQLNPLQTLGGLAAGQVLTPVVKAGSKKLGLDKLGDNISDAVFGSSTPSAFGGDTTPGSIMNYSPSPVTPVDTTSLGGTDWANNMSATDASAGGFDAGTAMAATAVGAAGASAMAGMGTAAAVDASYVVGGSGAFMAADAAAGAATAAEGAGLLETLGTAAVALWIICTELNKQGRLPTRHYVYGAKEFLSYDEQGKQGYYIWAIPSVRHLRKHPNSLYSKLMEVVFCARAEYLAAKAGCKGAKKTLLGAATTHGLYGFCWVLSRTIARKVYTKDQILSAGA